MITVVWQSESCSLHFYSYILMCKCSLLSHAYIIRARSTVLPRRGIAATLPIAAAGNGQGLLFFSYNPRTSGWWEDSSPCPATIW